MKKSGLSRRQLLALGSAAGAAGVLGIDPVRQMLSTMLQGLIAKARRQDSAGGPAPRNYVQINLYGSPSRWLFDHPLKPFDGDPFVANPGVINRFTHLDAQAPLLSRAEYADVKIGGINMPYLWNFDVPKAGGGDRPLADLIHNMLVIRGCDMGLDGHPGNSARLVSPVVGGASFTSLIADRARTPIPALSVGRTPANRAYRSERGTGIVDIPPEAPSYADFLLDAFIGGRGESFRDKANVDRSIGEALDLLKAYTLTNNAGAEILYNERDRSEQLIRRGLANLGGVYSDLVAKYADLISRGTGRSPIPGVTDGVVPGVSFPCSVPGKMSALEALASHHISNHIICDGDLREAFEAQAMLHMAQHFAITEFALEQGLSSSIITAPAKEMGKIFEFVDFKRSVNVKDIRTAYDAATATTRFTAATNPAPLRVPIDYDSHSTGSYINLVTCSLFYRAFGACLLELTDRLKAIRVEGDSLFDHTVVHVATEFERVPRDLGATSDHNYQGHMTSVFGGVIKGPMVLGNIYAGTEEPGTFQGTTGVGAPIENFPGKMVNQNVISSTLSELVGVRPLVPRAHPLVKVEGGQAVAQVEKAKNIEGARKNEKS